MQMGDAAAELNSNEALQITVTGHIRGSHRGPSEQGETRGIHEHARGFAGAKQSGQAARSTWYLE